MPFDPIDPKQPLAGIEPGIQAYWKQADIFKKSIKQRSLPNGDTSNHYTFYDGPPFATGLPHYGHILAGTIKDVIARYQTMQGKYVERRFGWDCHGLPIENIIEKEQNITNHKQITEELGVGTFCELCRSAVQRFATDWRTVVERMGRFVDMDYDYRTMDPEFMESIWWAFSNLYKQGLIYQGHKPMHICPRCVTPLSNFEVTQGYIDIVDTSVVAKFTLEDGRIALAWTTTPWTLPSNFLLAVGTELQYSEVEHDGAVYIVASALVENVFNGKEYSIKQTLSGKKLVGIKYAPLFPYFADLYKDTALYIAHGDFVTTTDGTGIVHIAPFGEDDYNLSVQENIQPYINVTMDGMFTEAMGEFAGQPVKPKGDHSSMDRKIAKWLKEHNALFSETQYKHSYPHCWRCDSPLLNYLTGSWFVSIEKVKQQMLLNKEQTKWVPAHLRDGRYGNWLENARDWAISRNRFWGTPLPIWQSPSGAIETIASRDDLMSKQKLRFTKVTVLRHGESEGNIQRIFQGKVPGTNLTEVGQKQAQATAEFLAKGKVDIIYASPMARTMQTAEHIAKLTGAEIVVDERLIERQFGEFEGQNSEVLGEKEYIDTATNPQLKNHKTGMEEFSSVADRFKSFIYEKLPRHRSEHIVVVTHGSLVRSAPLCFTTEPEHKVVNYPNPRFADPHTYFWDHKIKGQMDLHKHRIDDITWADEAAAKEECCTITLVRHGETDSNKQKILAGHSECKLTDTGMMQAKATAKALQKEHFDVLLHSDLHRAAHTATLINEELNITEVHAMAELRERHFGTMEGSAYEEVFKYAHDRSSFFDIPNNESLESSQALYERAEKVLQLIYERYKGKRVLVVSHGAFIAAALAYARNYTRTENRVDHIQNAEANTVVITPRFKRIPEVLDCWFESGSMPFAYAHYPFNMSDTLVPKGFPADFIAEGIDQCRAWFYTLMVLSTALFKATPFKNVVVNGIVLAEDGKKMSKKLKNYPEPMEIVNKYGADSIRFTLMNSPAVRGEDLRMSEQLVEQTLRSVLLPLWNTYSFYVTYANAAEYTPVERKASKHPLDLYILAETQDIVNRMTKEFNNYDLSATCSELFETIDALTNWYVRLSRRRFAGKNGNEAKEDALHTLHTVLLTFSKVLAPVCPFISEHIYQNLQQSTKSSVHLCDWPTVNALSKQEEELLAKMRTMRSIVALGLSVRGEANVKTRQPLQKATVAVPASIIDPAHFTEEDVEVLLQELNVKELEFAKNPEDLATAVAMVNARAAGPRLGKKVQEVIAAGKAGSFMQNNDGSVTIGDETLTGDEVQIMYVGKEGSNIAADRGIVVQIDTTISGDLQTEGIARDLIRTIQRLRKEAGYSFTDMLTVHITGFEEVLEEYLALITSETNTVFGKSTGPVNEVDINGTMGTISFAK